jgi:hypothetical protein
MATMTKNWKPDNETAEIFASYRDAIETERRLKPDVRERAEAALKAGATGTQLSRLTGMTPEVFRRMARDLDLPVDPRYAERAAASRRKRPTAEPNERPSPAPDTQPRDLVAALTPQQAADLAGRAFVKANPKQYQRLTAAAADGDRAVVAAALADQLLDAKDLRIA